MEPTNSVKICRDFDSLCDTMYVTYNDFVQESNFQNQTCDILLVKREDSTSGDYILSISNMIPDEFYLIREVYDSLKTFVK